MSITLTITGAHRDQAVRGQIQAQPTTGQTPPRKAYLKVLGTQEKTLLHFEEVLPYLRNGGHIRRAVWRYGMYLREYQGRLMLVSEGVFTFWAPNTDILIKDWETCN